MKLLMVSALILWGALIAGCSKSADTKIIEPSPTALSDAQQDALYDGQD